MIVIMAGSWLRAGNRELDAREIIDRAEQAHAWIDRSAVTSNCVRIWEDDQNHRIRSEFVLRQYRDSAHRVRLSVKGRVTEHPNASQVPFDIEQQYILAGKRHIYYVPAPATERARLQLARTETDVEKWRSILRHNPKWGAFLDGRVMFGASEGQSIFELARNGQCWVADTKDLVNGVSCYRLEADTPAGRMRMWIAPSKGFNVAKFELKGTGSGAAEFADYDVSVDDVRFGDVGGRTVMTGARYTDRYRLAGESSSQHTTIHISRSDIDIDPDFAALDVFSSRDIKDGVPATVEDDRSSGVQYVWSSGDAVPTVDAETMAQIRRQVAEHKNKPRPDATMPFEVPIVPAWASRVGIIVGASLGVLALWFAVERWLLPRLRAKGGS